MFCKFCNLEIEDYFQHCNNNKIHTQNLIKYFEYTIKNQYINQLNIVKKEQKLNSTSKLPLFGGIALVSLASFYIHHSISPHSLDTFLNIH